MEQLDYDGGLCQAVCQESPKVLMYLEATLLICSWLFAAARGRGRSGRGDRRESMSTPLREEASQ